MERAAYVNIELLTFQPALHGTYHSATSLSSLDFPCRERGNLPSIFRNAYV